MFIYICRHGETQWNSQSIYQGQLNSALTKGGIQQAQKLGAFLQDKEISQIYSSPLVRAHETAQIINRQVNSTITVRDELMEMNFGSLQGLQVDEALRQYQPFFELRKSAKAKTPFPGGESYYDVYNRVSPFINQLMKTKSDILIVGHESTNRIIRGILTDLSVEDACKIRQAHQEVIRISPEEKISTTFYID